MRRNASVLDVDRIVSVLKRRCDDMGVNLVWNPHTHIAATNGHTITLPIVRHPVTKDAMDKLYGFVIHEAGHHSRPEVFDIANAAQPPPPLACLYNITEDDGMERSVAQAYHGDAVALGTQNNITLSELAKEWKGKEWPEEMTEQDVAPLACCGIGQLSRLNWDGLSTSARSEFMNSLPPPAKKLLDELVSEGWVERFQGTNDEHDTWDVAVDLYKRIYPGADDEELEEMRAKGHSMQAPERTDSGEGEANQCYGSGGEGEAEGDKEGKSGLPDDQGKVISWKDAVLSEHDEWQPKELGAQPGNVGIDWNDYKSGDIALMPQYEVNVIDCRRSSDESVQDNTYHDGTTESFMPDNSQSRAFANQIRRYLQAQTRTKVRPERYHGRIDKRSLIKLVLPPIDGGEWNKKLFYDMEKAPGMDTCIHVLTDWSGSMQGDKMVHAADASGRLVHTFDRVLRVPVQLAAFTNGTTRCDIGLIKSFKERSVSPEDIAAGFSKFYKYSSANNDADAVMWAYNQLLRRDEERRILIVLSDGCPAGAYAGSGHSNLEHVCKTIQQEAKIELYGVGIMSGAVKNYYKNVRVLKKPEDINNTLFQIIKEGVKK